MSLTSENIKAGNNYKWKCGDEKLIYIGKLGNWHQFVLAEKPDKVWCEVLDVDLHMIEGLTDKVNE